VGGDFNVGGTASFNSNITGTVVGGLASSLLPTGSILQVVYSGTTASYTITSSFATTGFSATITPKRNNSKIYVLCSLNLLISNAAATGTSIHGRIVRNSTGIQDFSRLLYGADYNSTANHGGQQFILCQDTPNTTSSTTYTVHLYGSGTGGAYIMNYNATAPNTSPTWATSTMILVEVAV
jgi:hypothetical protein